MTMAMDQQQLRRLQSLMMEPPTYFAMDDTRFYDILTGAIYMYPKSFRGKV